MQYFFFNIIKLIFIWAINAHLHTYFSPNQATDIDSICNRNRCSMKADIAQITRRIEMGEYIYFSSFNANFFTIFYLGTVTASP